MKEQPNANGENNIKTNATNKGIMENCNVDNIIIYIILYRYNSYYCYIILNMLTRPANYTYKHNISCRSTKLLV